MHFSTLSPKQLAVLLPFLLALPHSALAVCDEDIYAVDDGPTSDKSAGIGMEFETTSLLFQSSGCSQTDTDNAKGVLLGPRQDSATPPTWMLTGDTTQNIAGQLTAEYILNGKVIELGQGQVGPAAAAAANDVTSWNPSNALSPNTVTVDQSPCNPWTISRPDQGGGAGNFQFAVQATAPLPLESINDIIRLSKGSGTPLLNGPSRTLARSVYVAQDFFQSSPQGVTTAMATADVLGFFALVLSYAKSASQSNPASSPKLLTGIMPRTDFVTIYAQISSKLPQGVNLWNLVNTLACYTNDGSGSPSTIDDNFCTGTEAAPVTGSQLGQQAFNYNGAQPLSVQTWINSITGAAPDALTTFDKNIDGQIGGLGNALENVINTQRAVPLFEYRNLGDAVTPSGFQNIATTVENALVAYHQQNAAPPTSKFKRDRRFAHNRRQDSCLPSVGPVSVAASSTSSSATPTSTQTPTPTSTQPAYATGTCHIHIDEYQIPCLDDAENLVANITMWDNSGAVIGQTQPDDGDWNNPGDFPGINAGSSLNMQSKLPNALQVTGEHENDYIQFTLLSDPQLSWTSRDTQGTVKGAYCNNGGWDPRDGPICSRFGTQTAKNQVDCWFNC